MSKLQNYNGRYCESENESAFLILMINNQITIQKQIYRKQMIDHAAEKG